MEASSELEQLRHALLTSRDHIIGLEAELGQLQAEVGRLRERRDVLRARARRAEEQVEAMSASTTWRVGRFFVAPTRAFRRKRA